MNSSESELFQEKLARLREVYNERFAALEAKIGQYQITNAAEFDTFRDSLTKEIKLAAEAIAKELVHLNELRKEVTTDRAKFISGDKYEADMKARDAKVEGVANTALAKAEAVERFLANRIEQLEKLSAARTYIVDEFQKSQQRLSILEKWQDQSGDVISDVGTLGTRLKMIEDWRNKLLGIGIMVGLVSGLLGAFLMRLISGLFGK